MKAVVVTPYYAPRIGGLENYARQLNEALKKFRGWEIVIVTSHHAHRQSLGTIDGNRIYRLGTWFTISNTPFNPLWLFSIRGIIRREKPDVIIAHSPVPSLADATALVRGHVPFVVVYHAATLLKQGAPLFNAAARFYGLFGRRTLRQATRIFAVSEFVRQRLPTKVRPKAMVVPNAVWADEVATRDQPAQAKFVFIASLARSHAWKGTKQVIDAMAIYCERYGDNFELTIIGDGDMRSTYERQASHIGMQNHIRFVGEQLGENKVKFIRKALAMIVYPVTENDAFPTVILEAWAQSVPIVASRIGALTTLVHDGRDGYLCQPKQPSALADKLHELVMASAASRAAVAKYAADQTLQHFTWEKQAELVDSEVRKLV